MWTESQILNIVLKSKTKTFYLVNKTTKSLAAHEIELRWNKFYIHKFRFSKQMSVLISKLALLFSVKNISLDIITHRRQIITTNHLNGGNGRIQAIISTVVWVISCIHEDNGKFEGHKLQASTVNIFGRQNSQLMRHCCSAG